MDNQPRAVPEELPPDYQAYRRTYRWPLAYGPWGLGLIGLAMVGVGLFGDRPGEVALAAIGFGAAMVIASVLLPRMQGPLELGPSGVKGAVHGLPMAFMVAAATARDVAEKFIPADEPDRARKVDEVVDEAVDDTAGYVARLREFGEQVLLSEDDLEKARALYEKFSELVHQRRQERHPPIDQDHDASL